MESPYGGRATINQDFDHIEISIPVKRNILIIAFLCFWLCGWFFGESFVIGTLIGGIGGGADLFMIVWLCGWTVGGIFVIKTLWWIIAGKEIVTAGKGVLEIKKQGDLFSKAKAYDLNECRGFRTVDNSLLNGFPFASYRPFGAFNNNSIGTIAFDYGMKTVKFAGAIDEAEGKHILNLLKSKGILKEANF